MPGFRKLESIRLVCSTGGERQATRNGNNAAWLCIRCNEEPLLGAGLPGIRDKLVRCRKCGAHYQVKFGKEGVDKNKPVRVVELPSAGPDKPHSARHSPDSSPAEARHRPLDCLQDRPGGMRH